MEDPLAELQRAIASTEKEDIEPTDEEKRNGWTKETLSRYLAERRAGQSLAADPESALRRLARRPTEQNHRYNPHKWR